MESPTFNEASLRQLEFKPKIVRETFNRAETLAQCPSHLRPIFEDLFRQIDTIELGINLYELAHNKRKEPPRPSLVQKFSQEEYDSISQQTKSWTQQKYLKMRHLIVELRREQFTLRDTYRTKITLHSAPEPNIEPTQLDFDSEIPIFPLGLINSKCAPLVFPTHPIAPSQYNDQEIEQLTKFYWSKKDCVRPKLHFDFSNPSHLYKLIGLQEEFEDQILDVSVGSCTSYFLDTLKFYVDLADLSDIQRDILELKIQKVCNADIVHEIATRHNKTYTINYISTIFTQKIIPKIIEAVQMHCAQIENLSLKENFKVCNMCGKELLKCQNNFVRKGRSHDGYSNRCKKCEKIMRKKEKKC